MTTICNLDVLAMWQRYCRLKLSLSLYHCLPWQLGAEQKMAFAGQLERQWRLEAAIREHAERRGIRADQKSIMTAQYVLRTFFDDEQSWNEALARAGIDEAGRLQALTHEAILTATLENVASLAPNVSEREIDEWYQHNTHRFQQPEQRLAHHLLLVIDDTQADCDRVTVTGRIGALQRRLQIDPRRFHRLANRFSECPTAMDGGKIGWVGRGVLYPTLDMLLFSLDANDISPVVESPMGLHVLWCEAIRPAGELPKAQALAQIRQQWQEKLRQQYQRRWLAEILG
ncbi:nitrogen fixation protein NifM [Brenneria goodwinii]|uniref:nitrogen fixation protein NifM n=1 Tax=Brenneria goodwinii TaxID=1109412 RepID=UPI000EF23BE0|nr:nitrogen fixation protein NifM [Brenneria goodwinii]MCG8156660.1 nitrogen fixation protein NifM [Brenneria goodwinii]MCG8159728.1 nitrogen fixation protein NifM [Brenneria goodwinii]MCG8165818.1 nitrogen fixation protein NifM [Brenneria goodwinii]MCG8170221.1 nitrogen fixation protein NifM [Brenneria goodwinii]MCG8173587.1 nitrogen fixation protein NifM [Brenneria goodwinii]